MKRNLFKIFSLLILSFLALSAYAIQVKVFTSFKKATGIGFTVNGQQHGGMGSKYEAKKMPKGMYAFGIRYNNKDIACLSDKGEKSVKLTKNTTANLVYKNGKCTLKIQ